MAEDKKESLKESDNTSYRKNGTIAKQSDLVSGNNIIVVGQSNSQGGINATAIDIK